MQVKRKKIMLLNPPSGLTVLRDYYCSTCPKSNYLWQPVDLIAMGAMLSEIADLQIIDCIGGEFNETFVIDAVRTFAPDAILSLVSSLTRDTDLSFLQRLHCEGRRIAISGEVALDPEFDFDRYPYIEGLILDFTSVDAANFMLGSIPKGRIRTAAHAPSPPQTNYTFRLGSLPSRYLPHHRYRMPFWPRGFYSLITDFGCPMSCDFCNSGRTCLGYKMRDIEDIDKELHDITTAIISGHNSGQFRRIYLRSMSFGANKLHDETVLHLLSAHKCDIHAFMHIDHLDDAFILKLENSGLSLAQIGIESPIENIRQRYGKSFSNQKAIDIFRKLDSIKIKAGAHFLVGFPEEPYDVVARCLRLCQDMKAAYCSINVYEPRIGIKPISTHDGDRILKLKKQAQIAMFRYNTPKYMRYLLTKLP